MVSTLFMVDTSSHPGTQLHRCVEKSAFLRFAGKFTHEEACGPDASAGFSYGGR